MENEPAVSYLHRKPNQNMKHLLSIVSCLLLALAVPGIAAAKDKDKKAGKEITITGEAKCAKCALHEGDQCQSVIQVEKKKKTLTYYLEPNDVTKAFHENVCKEGKKVTATGMLKK